MAEKKEGKSKNEKKEPKAAKAKSTATRTGTGKSTPEKTPREEEKPREKKEKTVAREKSGKAKGPKHEPTKVAPLEEKKGKKPHEEEDERQGKQTALVETDRYLNTGAHIGTKFKSGDMRKYIYKVRKDGLNVLDVQTLDERLKFAAKFLSGFPSNRIAVVSRKVYAQTPAKEFAEAVGAVMLPGRFVPGTFTNPESTRFFQPAVVLIADPEADSQAVKEATRMRIPVAAMASTNNSLRNVDLAIPINNKGKKSLALGMWILAKEILKEKGEIKDDSGFSKQPDDFEYKMKELEEDEKRAFKPRKWKAFSRAGGGSYRGGGPARGGGGRRRK